MITRSAMNAFMKIADGKRKAEVEEAENVDPAAVAVPIPKKQKMEKQMKRSTFADVVNLVEAPQTQRKLGTELKNSKSVEKSIAVAQKKKADTLPKPKTKKPVKKIPPKVYKKTLEKPPALEEDVNDELKPFCRIRKAGDYELGTLLGYGTFGVVREAIHKKTKKVKAVKFLRSRSLIQLELAILQMVLEHGENRYLGMPSSCVDFRFEGEMIKGFVMDKLQIDLYDVVHVYKTFIPSSSICAILAQVASANVFLNRIGMIHADLKLENIMLSDHHIQVRDGKKHLVRPFVKLIDFNSTLWKTKEEVEYEGCFQTDIYRSPEIALGCSYMDNVDMWSLGIIGLELITGSNFFKIEANDNFEVKLEAIYLKKILAACAPQKFTSAMISNCRHTKALHTMEDVEAGDQMTMAEVLSSRRKTEDMKRLSFAVENMLLIDYHKRFNSSQVLEALQVYINDEVQ